MVGHRQRHAISSRSAPAWQLQVAGCSIKSLWQTMLIEDATGIGRNGNPPWAQYHKLTVGSLLT